MLTLLQRRVTDKSEFSNIGFLLGGGEMGALTRVIDWSSSSLGAPEKWPEILKMTLRLMLNSKHPMFVFWGKDFIQFYNDAYRATIGPERHPSALGQSGRECWAETWDIIGPQIESIMAGGPATWHEDQLIPLTRHGQRENVYWTYWYSPTQGSGGVGGVLVICNDITEEHLAKEELTKVNLHLKAEIRNREEAKNRLQSLFRQAPGFMASLTGPEHTFDFANTAYERLSGYRGLIGLTVREAFPEFEDQGFFKLLDEVYATGNAYVADNIALKLRRPGDAEMTHCYLDMMYQPMVDGVGSVTGIFVEGYDVTARYLAQQALLVSELRLQEGLKAARMTVWDMDISSGTIKFSEEAETVFGRSRMATEEAWKHVCPDDLERLQQARNNAIEKCGTYEDVVKIMNPSDGSLAWLQVSGNITCDKDNRPIGIRGFSLDVTALKRAEQTLKAADRCKDEFLAVLAHELRNPLAAIFSASQIFKRFGKTEPCIAKAGDIVSRQAEHMTNLINDLLDVSRITTGLISIGRTPVTYTSSLSSQSTK